MLYYKALSTEKVSTEKIALSSEKMSSENLSALCPVPRDRPALRSFSGVGKRRELSEGVWELDIDKYHTRL